MCMSTLFNSRAAGCTLPSAGCMGKYISRLGGLKDPAYKSVLCGITYLKGITKLTPFLHILNPLLPRNA